MVRPKVGDDAALQAHHPTVGLDVNLENIHLVASVDGCLQILAPALDPFHRPPELLRCEAGHGFFAINVELAAERPAHFRRDDAAACLVRSGHHGQVRLQQVRDLRGRPNGQSVFSGRVARNDPARFHGSRRQALVDKTRFDHLEARVGFKRFPAAGIQLSDEGDVVRKFLMDARRSLLKRFFRVHHRGDGLIVHFHFVRGIASQVKFRRDNGGNGLAHVADFSQSQARVVGNLQPLHRYRAWDQAQLALDVRPREHFSNARHGARLIGLNGLDAGVSVRAAHKNHV